MPLAFYNIRSKERRIAETEPQIAALWGSSDRSPNAIQGQDFGWRLAPEVAVELKRIKSDITELEKIATRYKLLLEDVTETAILHYISDRTSMDQALTSTQEGDYTDEYEAEVRRLEKQAKKTTK